MIASILCGGEGARLRPLTYAVPKPLLPLGSKPILEVTIERMRAQGFSTFFLMVNYKAEMISSYFGDGSIFKVKIRYFEEKMKRGTAGPLSFLKGQVEKPIVVMNADVLTSIDFRRLMDFHIKMEADLTVALKRFNHQVEYGVVEMTSDSTITQVTEKPSMSFLINSGIYVVSPSAVSIVPDEGEYPMPELIEDVGRKGLKAVGYEFDEPWRDIGRIDDYMKILTDLENGQESDADGVFR